MDSHYYFDLDGTVTNQELLPLIARELGLEYEMSVLTKNTMEGKIPFDHSFTIRVGMLKSINIDIVQNIVSKVSLSETIVEFLKKNKRICSVVTGNLDIWIKPLMKIIPVKFYTSKAHYSGNKLIGIERILRKGGVVPALPNLNTIAIGDGNNDLEMLTNAKIAIAYGGVHQPAFSLYDVADYVLFSDKKLCTFLQQLS